ncbi:MAG: hypothetical protein K0V04_36065 [Deltaproteobacteria bacterium]|nr:hypothetical protein [Deltaproteobacteria bacterium]
MKLRILDDSLRLRLPRGDVERLRATGRIEAAIHFGPGPQQRLVYAIAVDPQGQRMRATLTGTDVVVHIPQSVAHAWADGEEISLSADQSLGDGRTLSLLVEKDFKCVVTRPGEDGYDGYDNPNTSC